MSHVAYLAVFVALALLLTWLRVQRYRQLHPVRRARVPVRRR